MGCCGTLLMTIIENVWSMLGIASADSTHISVTNTASTMKYLRPAVSVPRPDWHPPILTHSRRDRSLPEVQEIQLERQIFPAAAAYYRNQAQEKPHQQSWQYRTAANADNDVLQPCPGRRIVNDGRSVSQWNDASTRNYG
jgi:hypothetical protein